MYVLVWQAARRTDQVNYEYLRETLNKESLRRVVNRYTIKSMTEKPEVTEKADAQVEGSSPVKDRRVVRKTVSWEDKIERK